MSYYGLVLDLQNLGSDIFLLQVFFGVIDLLARVTTPLLLSFLGRRIILVSFHATAGVSILANTLLPRGEVGTAWRGGPEGSGHWLPRPCPLGPPPVSFPSPPRLCPSLHLPYHLGHPPPHRPPSPILPRQLRF